MCWLTKAKSRLAIATNAPYEQRGDIVTPGIQLHTVKVSDDTQYHPPDDANTMHLKPAPLCHHTHP